MSTVIDPANMVKRRDGFLPILLTFPSDHLSFGEADTPGSLLLYGHSPFALHIFSYEILSHKHR